MRDGRLGYAEGYAAGRDGGALIHSWAVDRRGRVHEPTWPALGAAYFGIVSGPST